MISSSGSILTQMIRYVLTAYFPMLLTSSRSCAHFMAGKPEWLTGPLSPLSPFCKFTAWTVLQWIHSKKFSFSDLLFSLRVCTSRSDNVWALWGISVYTHRKTPCSDDCWCVTWPSSALPLVPAHLTCSSTNTQTLSSSTHCHIYLPVVLYHCRCPHLQI